MMALPWVQGDVVGTMDDGAITARVVTRRQMEGGRPKTFEESGADLLAYQRLNRRGNDFGFQTKGFMGGAVAWLLKNENLFWREDQLMARVIRHNGGLPLPADSFCALIRNAGAPTIQFCAEPAGGMCEDPQVDWLFHLLEEGLELGVYSDDGYAGFMLPHGYEQYQEALDIKQADWWSIVQPGIQMSARAEIEFLPIGVDTLNGEAGIIVPCFAAGEFSFIKAATLHLGGRGGWKLCDLECHKAATGWVPLNRAVACITPSPIGPPMYWRFSRSGGLDECGPHFPIVEGVASVVLSHLSEPLLGEHGLGWLQ